MEDELVTKEEVQYKLMECKKLYTTCSDTFFKIYNPEYYTVISDTLESMEEDIEEFESCEVYEDISKRLDNFINVIQNMDFFYKAGKY
jgi:hypothetical protein